MLPRRRWNNPARPPRQRRSRGAILAVFAIVLVVLLGLVGLVVDGGLLLATHRQAQNAADAAAMAAAMHRMRGYSSNDATSVARTFVTSYNGLAKATTAVNWPPATGPYAGMNGFVEVTVTTPMQTCFIHLLGVGRQQQAIARAVAGYEPRSAGEGVMVLDPTHVPDWTSAAA